MTAILKGNYAVEKITHLHAFSESGNFCKAFKKSVGIILRDFYEKSIVLTKKQREEHDASSLCSPHVNTCLGCRNHSRNNRGL